LATERDRVVQKEKGADPHIASMLLAHKTVSEDELLRRYANLPWEELFVAQRKVEEELTPVFDAAGPDPFGNKPRAYIGIQKTKAIFELNALGHTPQEIAARLETTVTTVYRHLAAKFGKRKPGRKKKVNGKPINGQHPNDGHAEPGN
jgi:hypothetical protein